MGAFGYCGCGHRKFEHEYHPEYQGRMFRHCTKCVCTVFKKKAEIKIGSKAIIFSEWLKIKAQIRPPEIHCIRCNYGYHIDRFFQHKCYGN